MAGAGSIAAVLDNNVVAMASWLEAAPSVMVEEVTARDGGVASAGSGCQ